MFQELLAPYEDDLSQLGACESNRLAAYLDHLWARNQDLNLVSRKMLPEALVTDHLLDSLIALPHLPAATCIADLGTGGGLPAIPLALSRPGCHFQLYEKSPLKCKFLKELKGLCPNIEIMGPLTSKSRLEDVDLVVARGFKSVAQTLQMTPVYHARKGAYALYKARRTRIDEELAAVPELDTRVVKLSPYGDIEERHLVLID